jgi:hypothetical protein
MPDSHKNFAYSTVSTAPSPDDSGTSLVVNSGDGVLFPTPPFNATVWPAASQPLVTNAEIVRVTNIATDTFTITRAQEGSTARHVAVDDQIAATVTAKTLTDAESGLYEPSAVSGRWYRRAVTGTTLGNAASTLNKIFVSRILLAAGTLDRIAIQHLSVSAASEVARLGIYKDSSGRPGALVVDAGTVDLSTAAGYKALTISAPVDAAWYWLAAVRQGPTNTAGLLVFSNDEQRSGSTQWVEFDGLILQTTLTLATLTDVSGALPDPFGTPTMSQDEGTAPVVAVRYA